MEKKKEFLEELTALTKKYGIYIDGCGCCGSPYLTKGEPSWASGDLAWDDETKEYTA